MYETSHLVDKVANAVASLPSLNSTRGLCCTRRRAQLSVIEMRGLASTDCLFWPMVIALHDHTQLCCPSLLTLSTFNLGRPWIEMRMYGLPVDEVFRGHTTRA